MRSRLCPSRGPERPVQEMWTALKNLEDSTWTLKSRWLWTHMPSRQQGTGEAAAGVSIPDGRPDKDASQLPVTAPLVAGRLLWCPVLYKKRWTEVRQRSWERLITLGGVTPAAWLLGALCSPLTDGVHLHPGSSDRGSVTPGTPEMDGFLGTSFPPHEGRGSVPPKAGLSSLHCSGLSSPPLVEWRVASNTRAPAEKADALNTG